MSQVSYGTITITDTNDIERIYMEYAQSTSNSVAPTSSEWSESIPTWKQGYYIWQRTVTKMQGVPLTNDSYGDPVCLTGSTGSQGPQGTQGLQGNTGVGVSSITTTYCNYGTGTPAATYSGWQTTVPVYDSSKPNYWVKTVVNYNDGTSGTPVIYKDNGITSATSTAAAANTTANQANQTAGQANQTANQANETATQAATDAANALRRTEAKYGTSSTGASTKAKVATCTDFTLFNGAEVFIKFTNKNSIAAPTLNVNSTGAKLIKDSSGDNLVEQFYWGDGSLVHFVYDSQYWRILDIVTVDKYNTLVSDINGLTQTVGQKANQTDLANLTARVSTNETHISQNSTDIALKANSSDVYTKTESDGLISTEVTNRNAAIVAKANEITQTVSETYATQTALNGVESRVSTNESSISQNASDIALKVSSTDFNGNNIISKINLNSTTATIEAERVNIAGATIFTSGRLSETSLNNAYDANGSASAVNTALESYKTTTNSTLSSLQSQVDGQIEAWYYNVDPTTSNAPASSWDTDALKARHEGDLYYNVVNGHSWRWMKSGSTYSWQQIPDSDAAAALATAQAAETLAGSKKRIFTSQPTPPYDIGDLWVNGSQVKYCSTSKTTGESYAAADWTLTATDDTTAQSALNIANAAAPKTNAVAKTQRIYYRSNSSTKPTGYPTVWVTEEGNKWNNDTTTTSGWSRKAAPISNGTGASVTKYLYLWTATQKQMVDGTVVALTANDIALDDSSTVIDGGNIITGSIAADKISVENLSAINANMGIITAGKIEKGYNSINFDNTPATLEFKNQSTWNAATQGIKYDSNGLAIKGAITATSLTINGIDYIGQVPEIQNKASNSAEYEVVIKVKSIDYTTPEATLIAIPTKLGASTTGTFIWYKNAIGTPHDGTVTTTTTTGNTDDTLTVTDLDALYIAVLQ